MGGLPTSTVNGFSVHPTNPKRMYVALRDGVFRTDGAGDRWARLAGGPANVAAVVVNPRRSNEVVAATTDGRIFASPDEGETWQPVK